MNVKLFILIYRCKTEYFGGLVRLQQSEEKKSNDWTIKVKYIKSHPLFSFFEVEAEEAGVRL